MLEILLLYTGFNVFLVFRRSIKTENKVLLNHIQIFYADKILENTSLLSPKSPIEMKGKA